MARKTKQEAQETRQHILDVALRLFSQQGVSSTSLGEIAKAAGVTRGAIYWHFKDKSDLFSEIWELSESNIGELELEYQAKFPGDPLSVLREILIIHGDRRTTSIIDGDYIPQMRICRRNGCCATGTT